MRRLLAVVAALIAVACKLPTTTTAPELQPGALVLDTDSIVFVEGGVQLDSSLFSVIPQGDTTYNPDGVTVDLPAGFTRDGDRIRVTREAAGLMATLANSGATYEASADVLTGQDLRHSQTDDTPQSFDGKGTAPFDPVLSIRTIGSLVHQTH